MKRLEYAVSLLYQFRLGIKSFVLLSISRNFGNGLVKLLHLGIKNRLIILFCPILFVPLQDEM